MEPSNKVRRGANGRLGPLSHIVTVKEETNLSPLKITQEKQLNQHLYDYFKANLDSTIQPYTTMEEALIIWGSPANALQTKPPQISRKRGSGGERDHHGRDYKDWLKGLMHYVSKEKIFFFIFNKNYDVKRMEILSHMLHYLYDTHGVHTEELTFSGDIPCALRKKNNTHYTLKAVGALFKVVNNRMDAVPKSRNAASWCTHEDVHMYAVAKVMSSYLCKCHPKWKPPSTWKCTPEKLLTENLTKLLANAKSKVNVGIYDPNTYTKGSGTRGLPMNHYRSVHYLFDVNGEKSAPLFCLSTQWKELIKAQKDRVYYTEREEIRSNLEEERVVVHFDA